MCLKSLHAVYCQCHRFGFSYSYHHCKGRKRPLSYFDHETSKKVSESYQRRFTESTALFWVSYTGFMDSPVDDSTYDLSNPNTRSQITDKNLFIATYRVQIVFSMDFLEGFSRYRIPCHGHRSYCRSVLFWLYHLSETAYCPSFKPRMAPSAPETSSNFTQPQAIR